MAAVIPRPTIQVYDATGSTALGFLQDCESLTLSEVRCDLGAMRVDFPRSIGGASLLDTDQDRQLRVRLPGAPDRWFVLDEDGPPSMVSDDPASETVSVTCRDLNGLLDEAIVLPAGGVGSVPAERTFTGQSPGAIVSALWSAAQSAGWLQNVTLTGGGSTDAAGVAWPSGAAQTITYQAGMTLLAVMRGLAERQVMEWRWNGRALELHRWGGGMDRDQGVTLRPRRDVVEARVSRSRRSQATDVLVEGDDDETTLRTQTLSGRRKRAAYVSQQGASTSGARQSIGDQYLAAHNQPDVQLTHDLVDGEDSPLPWVDYRPGDRVYTRAASVSVVSRRVEQIALELGGDGAKVTLELGSILRAAEERFAAMLARLAPEANL